jgi:hypothetical protein
VFDKLRAGDTLVVRWLDRLGRNYDDVCDTIREFMRRGVVIRTVINNFTFDGATKDSIQKATRDALIAFIAATAQARSRSHQNRSEGWNRVRESEGRCCLPLSQIELHPPAIRTGPRFSRPRGCADRSDRRGKRTQPTDGLSDQRRPDQRRSVLSGLGDVISGHAAESEYSSLG